ncbi:MAG: EamA family transporter [Ferruginibacter sp.]|nr:EamA family transporter [Bacteroidota bacterium]MBX2917873.1 EamA family transporter [Ferruginibacter sp.]MCB0708640.1 EamA family transporter [Chitinophagaceae bacterium]MCC7380125.1 EamA family transporter [Chitinophagaceae bacterium]
MITGKKLPQGKTGGYMALCITSVVWGTTWVASKIGISGIPALQMAFIRQLAGGGCFVLFFLFYKKLPLPNLKQFGWLVTMGLLMFVFANGLSTWSLAYIPTGLSALIGALYPLSVVIIEMVFFKDRNQTPLTFTGLFLGIAGIGIVFYESAFNQQPQGYLFGISLSIIAMLSWSVGTLFLTRSNIKMNPYYAMGWQMLISAVMLYVFANITGQTIPLQAITGTSWLAILYLVLMGSILSFVAFIYSMKKLPVAIASLYAYINPLVAMIIAAILLHEKLTVYIMWGSVVTLLGVFLVNYSIRQQQKKFIAEPEQ